MRLVEDLRLHQKRHYSQFGEDGVIARIFEIVGIRNKFYVELGAGAGLECNTRFLREKGWFGVALDRNNMNPSLSLFREFVTAENVNRLLEKHRVPSEFDLLSVDLDGNDYWIWRQVASRFRPRVVVVEFNGAIPSDVAVTMPYLPLFRWAGEPNIGQSLLAAKKFASARGYSLILAAPPNAFLVLRSLLPRDYVDIGVDEAWGANTNELHPGQRRRWNNELRHYPWVYV